MEFIRRTILVFVYGVARFLDDHFYYLVGGGIALAIFNYFFIKDWDKILFVAAKDGNIKDLKDAIVNEAEINQTHAHDCTALIAACAAKQLEAVKILLMTEKCKVEMTDVQGRSALLLASSTGDVEIVKELLKYQADVKAVDHIGNSPLIVASMCGHADICHALLVFKAETKWKNKQGVNALAAAINSYKTEGDKGCFEVIKTLLKHKANVESKGASGWTPIIKASYKGFLDVVELLVENGADVNAQGKKGFTALIAASQNGWTDVVKFLLLKGADPTAVLEDGSTALVAASYGGYEEIASILAEEPKCLQMRYKNGSTALMTATLNGFTSVVKSLLEKGIDVNAVNDEQWSSLTVACEKGCYNITKLLLEYKADIDCCNNKGDTPLSMAIKNGYTDIVDLLLNKGASVNHFTVSVTISDEGEEVATIDEKIPMIYGYLPPLMLAIARRDHDLVEKLLARGADLYLDLALFMSEATQPGEVFSAKDLEEIKKQSDEATERIAALKGLKPSEEAQDKLAAANQRLDDFEQAQKMREEALMEATMIYSYFATPLLFAVYVNDIDIIRTLLKHEKDPYTLPPAAAVVDDKEKKKEEDSKEKRNDVNTSAKNTKRNDDKQLTTAAEAATSSESLATPSVDAPKVKSKYLPDRILNQTNAQDINAIQLAAKFDGMTDVVLLLMDYGAEFPYSQRYGWTLTVFTCRMIYHWEFIALCKFVFIALWQLFTHLSQNIGSSSRKSSALKEKKD